MFLGFDFSSLEQYVKNGKHPALPALQPQQPQKHLSMLQAGIKQPLPSYIPQHLPVFPDPHAYIRTPVSVSLSRHACVHFALWKCEI